MIEAGVPSALTRRPLTRPGTSARPMKRRMSVPVPSLELDVGAHPGPLNDTTETISPRTVCRSRSTTAAMAVVLTFSLASASLSCSTSM